MLPYTATTRPLSLAHYQDAAMYQVTNQAHCYQSYYPGARCFPAVASDSLPSLSDLAYRVAQVRDVRGVSFDPAPDSYLLMTIRLDRDLSWSWQSLCDECAALVADTGAVSGYATLTNGGPFFRLIF